MFRRKRCTFAAAVLLGCAAALLCGSMPGVCQAVKDLPRSTDYVNDFAHVMSPGAKLQLDHLCGEVDHQAHAQIAVVTINTTNGEPIQQYAVELEDAWKVGNKQDRGVILLIAVNDRRRFIETGYGLEGILPDAKVGQIGRQMVPMLRNNDFDGALTLATDEIAQIIADDAGVKLTPLTRQGAATQPQHATPGQIIGGIIFLILIVIFLLWAGGSGLLGFLLGMFFGGGWGGRGGGGGWGGGGDGGSDGGSGFGGWGGGSTGGGGAGGDW
ncbi:TPM domain-containing protein [Paracidobacterium acidisoli]|nr:TPM domain-containing protein [Paracidobacterium acidisoli]MBT9330377.1 TPM domain-containing protein [Paracidobacterium acidisoli]